MVERDIIDIETPVFISRYRYYCQRTKSMLKALFSIEPVIPNIMALILCAVVLYVLNCKNLIPNIGKYHDYLYHIIQFLICYQVIISAKKALILPLGIMLFSISAIIIFHSSTSFPIPITILKEMVLIGVIGTAVSIFHMR